MSTKVTISREQLGRYVRDTKHMLEGSKFLLSELKAVIAERNRAQQEVQGLSRVILEICRSMGWTVTSMSSVNETALPDQVTDVIEERDHLREQVRGFRDVLRVLTQMENCIFHVPNCEKFDAKACTCGRDGALKQTKSLLG